MTAPLLEVRGLEVAFPSPAGRLAALRGVDFHVAAGEVLGLVGESGSGKSLTMLSIMGLLAPNVEVSGSVRLDGEELLGRTEAAMRRYRGRRIAMIFQDPMTALNPVIPIGDQIVEAIRIHQPGLSRRSARERAVELLSQVAIPDPRARAGQYPFEFSGGMRQRAMIAMALANDPELLIADEPTTALDVTIQAQVIEVMERLRRDRGIGLILITHDLGLVAGVADRVAIMYAGRVVEQAATAEVFYRPRHPYTRRLLASLPRFDDDVDRLATIDGVPPSPARRPPGCAFAPRCLDAVDRCAQDDPLPRRIGASAVACHRAEELPA
ncbi:MAG: ABC transporter ATP-binding protein [Alphaproteobacteria bacterium]|jgi:oligopeptide/dipeptide ABC transporter ATP-binding protein|nr:ABC transporter ATP-binding protein [Alphaproteobacteria bacterium]